MAHVTNRRTYRQVAADEYGLFMCSSHDGCRNKLSASAHRRGVVKAGGVIHYSHADTMPRKTGLRRFLLLVGWALHRREWQALPPWERIYVHNIWVYREARARFHTMITVKETTKDRGRAARLAYRSGVKLRSCNFLAYQWAHAPLYTGPLAKR